MCRILVAMPLALTCLAFGGCGVQSGNVEESASAVVIDPTGERPLDSIALIDQAVAAGRIDYSTGLLYKVYAMFEPESLPQEYRSDVPAKCGTPVILEVQRNWSRLLPEQRAEIEMYVHPISEPDDSDTQLDDITRERLDHDANGPD